MGQCVQALMMRRMVVMMMMQVDGVGGVHGCCEGEGFQS